MTTFETITGPALDTVSGGRTRQAGHQNSQAQEVCNREQYDWMAAHMVPETSMKPGVKRHVIAKDSRMCGFPMPPG